MQQSWKIAFAYIGVIVGAGLSSGQDLLQYFISFGQIGLIGVLLLGLLNDYPCLDIHCKYFHLYHVHIRTF